MSAVAMGTAIVASSARGDDGECEFAVRNLAIAALVAVTVLGRTDFVAFAAVMLLVQIPLLLPAVALFRHWAARHPHPQFTKGTIVRDESVSWNVNIGYTADGIGEMTILDAGKLGIYPVQVEQIVADAA